MKTFLFSDHIYNQQMVLDKECFKKRSRRLLSIQVGNETLLLFPFFHTFKRYYICNIEISGIQYHVTHKY